MEVNLGRYLSKLPKVCHWQGPHICKSCCVGWRNISSLYIPVIMHLYTGGHACLNCPDLYIHANSKVLRICALLSQASTRARSTMPATVLVKYAQGYENQTISNTEGEHQTHIDDRWRSNDQFPCTITPQSPLASHPACVLPVFPIDARADGTSLEFLRVDQVE